jgi:hypothetical protein
VDGQASGREGVRDPRGRLLVAEGEQASAHPGARQLRADRPGREGGVDAVVDRRRRDAEIVPEGPMTGRHEVGHARDVRGPVP